MLLGAASADVLEELRKKQDGNDDSEVDTPTAAVDDSVPEQPASTSDPVDAQAPSSGNDGPPLPLEKVASDSTHGKDGPSKSVPSISENSSARATKQVLKRGWLVKQGGARKHDKGLGLFSKATSRETWNRRWVVLYQNRMTWSDTETGLPKGEVFLKGATIDPEPAELSKQPLAFAVRHAERTLFARANDEQDRRQWLAALHAAVSGTDVKLISVASDIERRRSSDGSVLPPAKAQPGATAKRQPGPSSSMVRNHEEDAKRKTEMEGDGGEWWKERLPVLTSQQGGFLLKQGQARRNWNRRYAVLQASSLLYYKEEKLCGVVPVRGATIDDHPSELKGRKFGFAVRHPERVFLAATETEREFQNWLNALRAVAQSRPTSQEELPLDDREREALEKAASSLIHDSENDDDDDTVAGREASDTVSDALSTRPASASVATADEVRPAPIHQRSSASVLTADEPSTPGDRPPVLAAAASLAAILNGSTPGGMPRTPGSVPRGLMSPGSGHGGSVGGGGGGGGMGSRGVTHDTAVPADKVPEVEHANVSRAAGPAKKRPPSRKPRTAVPVD